MNILDLLDKPDMTQIKVIQKLLNEGGVASVKDLGAQSKVSTASLNKYLKEMNERVKEINPDIDLVLEDKKIEINIPNYFNFQHILIHYLTDSINCKIIMYMSKHDGASLTQLTQELAISEATLFRRLKDINKIISEFNIQIKNARFVGDELQIRYFLFEFYNHALPINVINYHTLDDSIVLLIENLSKELGVPIEEKNYYHLYLWLLISKRRELQGTSLEIDQQEIYRKLCPDPFFQAVYKTNETPLGSTSAIQTETDIICLFVFFISTYIYEKPLSDEQYVYFLKNEFLKDIINLTENTLETIGRYYPLENMEEALIWHIECNLFQLHFRLVHFNSYISYFESDYMMSNQADDHISQIVNDVIYEHLTFFNLTISPAIYDHVFANYRFILQTVESQCVKSIKVGLAIQVNYLAQQDILNYLEKVFTKEFKLTLKIAEVDEMYDVLITDIFLTDSSFKFKEIYVINDGLNMYDEKMIRKILSESIK